MKRFFRFVMAAAVLFGAVACSQNPVEEVVADQQVTTKITIGLENLGTRLAGDSGMIDKVAWGVYNHKEDGTGDFLLAHSSANDAVGVADFKNGAAEIEITLFTGKKYDLVFWGYCSANSAYSIDWENRELNVNYAGQKANVEANDAFFHIENGFRAGQNQTFTLRRPFAQLNAGQSYEDYNIMQLTGNSIVASSVVAKAYKTMNLVNGSVSNLVDVELLENAVVADDLTVSGVAYKHLAMNYLLVNEKEVVNTVTFQFLENGEVAEGNGTVFTRQYYNVPLQRNYRTNILGSLISDEYKFTIVIDDEFDGDNNSYVERPENGTLEELINENVLAQESAQIVLNDNVTWTTGAGIGSTPLVPEGSALMDLVIEGVNITRAGEQPVITFIGNGVGAVRAANGGTITFRNVKIVDQSVSYAESSWEYGYLELGGNLKFENCTFVNAVQFGGANASFTNCYFNSNDSNQYALWICDGNVKVKNSTIEGWRGIKAHEAYGSEVVSVEVDNCDFTLTKKPGLAIGDINAETTIAIKNSTFNTQAGDQGLYIYETDTDVTTFNFTLENNKLVASSNEDLNTIISKAGSIVVLQSGEYTLPAKVADNVVIEGAQGAEVIINAPKAANLGSSNLTFRNVTINKSNTNYNGFQHANLLTYEDCVINNQIFLYGAKEVFTRCTFNQTSADAYNVWTYGAKEVVFNECVFNSAGKSVLVYTETLNQVATVTLNGCTLNASAPVEGKAAVEIDSSFPNGGNGSYVVTINNTTANGFGTGNKSGISLWNNKKGTKTTVVVDGVEVLALGMECIAAGVTRAEGVYYINSAAGMYWLANEVNVAKNAFNGVTVKLAADIDLNNSVWEPIGQTGKTTFNGVFDGQNYTISNLNINSEAQTGAYYSSGLFGWVETHSEGNGHLKNVKINGANVVGHHNCGALVGYITEKYALVENCHVANATISCTYANGDADGDKAGALIGNATNATLVNGCTAADSTISAGRDSGQLIGAAKEANVTNCSATNVTVTANGTGTGKNIRNEVVGRAL